MTTTTAPSVTHSRSGLAGQLSELGVEPGGVLLVHASMRAVGPVAGGVRAMAGALRDALGAEGTLVVPAFTPENSDTSAHYLDRVRGLDDRAREAVRDSMPPFDPVTSAAPSMGSLAEAVRLGEGAVRSDHPQTSFAAIGPLAQKLLSGHRPDCHLGEDSPLAGLYELRAQVLLLGTGFGTCTAFHLGEYRVPAPPRRSYRCVVTAGGRRRWWEYEDVALDDSDFAALGADFAGAHDAAAVRSGPVGSSTSRLFRITDAVDHATRWLTSRRAAPPVRALCHSPG
ncbi:AAC(3) family N-acetyltransferase [Streptomyces sp. JV185]|uniref:aminoglycoside N(3)-acetyltransferase n=1 Tax=Streptomyces sp. JV185 TaxID=858638 RepID=UPI002E760554|nr:AAC(3) family N-acetyltransferase [Streptomyces sp. JV185]MEE1768257.1 AAC(3) family N-acetyltransferase [Streptomyces sp. JV185]